MATAAELKARLAKYATKKEETNDAPKAQTDAAPVAQTEPVRVPAVPQTVENVVEQRDSIEVRTDVQSTDVVVVERPVEQGIEDRNTASFADTKLDITNPVHQSFLQRLADVEAALLARDPLMKTHLGAIHKAMIEYEEIPNLLRPEEIAKIMAAQQAHTGIVLRAEVVGKSKAAAGKKAAGLGLNDV